MHRDYDVKVGGQQFDPWYFVPLAIWTAVGFLMGYIAGSGRWF